MPPNQPLEPTSTNNAEIDQALKEFEATNGTAKVEESSHHIQAIITPRVSKPRDINDTDSVKFEVPNYKIAGSNNQNDNTSKMARFVIKYSGGAIKDQRQAEWILFGFVLVAVGISIYLLFGTGSRANSVTPTMIEKMKNDQRPISP